MNNNKDHINTTTTSQSKCYIFAFFFFFLVFLFEVELTDKMLNIKYFNMIKYIKFFSAYKQETND